MRQVPLEALMHAENALAYSKQALAILKVWMDSLDEGDEHESSCVAVIHSLVYGSKEYLQKATRIQSAKWLCKRCTQQSKWLLTVDT